MRLIRLRLQNFRQHAATEIEFRPGLTGIIGPNGAGKSTILEAIGWVIYGSAAARGTNDTIRFVRAPARSRVEVELVFALAGHEYRVVRTLHHAEVFVDGGSTPVASTLGGVTSYLEDRLSMTREEFFNTYFTGQKELQFLEQLGPAQRGRFLGQVLGYERLRLAQDRVRSRRNELRHELEGLRAGMPDPVSLRIERESAESRRREATAALKEAEAEGEAAARVLAELQPRWAAAQAARERDRELLFQAESTRREREGAERDEARLKAELEAIAAAEAELGGLRVELAQLPDLTEECARLAELARLDERRRALEETERQLAQELAAGAQRLERLEDAPRYLEQYRQELAEARGALAAAEAEVQARHAEWIERRQETETKLQSYRDRAHELKEHIQRLRAAGPAGICPTCEQPLGKNFEGVIARLEDEWETLVQDGKWLKQRLEQLQARPDEVVAAESARNAAQQVVEEKNQRVARCERAVQELERLRVEQARRAEQLERWRSELAGLPQGYDAERHRAAETRLRELRGLERRASRLEQIVEARPAREAELAAARERIADAVARVAALEAERAALRFEEAEFERLRQEVEVADDAVRRAELRVTELRGVLHAAEEALEVAVRAESAYRERLAELRALEIELRHHNELDAAFTQLRGELNARVRPELSQIASGFLTQITDGRYTALEVDDNYNILVLDEGEEKPVISGGEEDVANLVIRLAISQMIAERAGHPLSVLILDEVFGSLDIERRDRVIELLHKLSDRFEQVILVDYDERNGTSVVREVGGGVQV